MNLFINITGLTNLAQEQWQHALHPLQPSFIDQLPPHPDPESVLFTPQPIHCHSTLILHRTSPRAALSELALLGLSPPRLLQLRPLRREHLGALIELFVCPDTAPYITDGGPLPHPVAMSRLLHLLEESNNRINQTWSLLVNQEVVGMFTLSHAQSRAPAVTYAIRKPWRNKGYASTALLAVCTYSAENGVHHIIAHTHLENVASAAVLTRCGFVESRASPVFHTTGWRREFHWPL